MEQKGNKNSIPSFIEMMGTQLKEYQLQKIMKFQQKVGPRQCQRQKEAKLNLIELDDQMDVTQNSQEDVHVGRWANYRVPQRVEERLGWNKKIKRISLGSGTNYRYLENQDRNFMPSVYRSQKTIPKLKVILHQLDCALNVQTERKIDTVRAYSQNPKMKNHISPQALVISNKEEIKASLKSQRKTIATITKTQFFQNGENRRPPTGKTCIKGQQTSSSYQKIKRTFGNQDHELVYEKQILSQLIKNNVKKVKAPQTNTSPLSNMLNYFTRTDNDTKKKISAKLGLDRLLS